AATGTLSNTATVTAPAGVTDPNPANNSATDTDTIAASADLAITKTDGVTTVTAGGSLTYTIVASNAGPSNATGATVADTFPASLTCTWTCVGAGGGTCTASGSGNISGTVNLPAGGSVTYTASCTLSAAATGTLSNTATVAAPAGVTDPNPANNSATDTDTITTAPTPSVSGTKSVTGNFIVGGTVTYTIVLTNSGTGAQGDNPGHELTDVLPAGLALVSATATSGNAVATVATNTVTWDGSIPAGGSVTITITATILPAAAGTTVTNQGTISFDSDGNGTNDATAQTDDPATAGTANPTTFVVAGPPTPEVPTLSPLGLLLLTVILAGLAIALLKRRQGAEK
ncbi:MAG TPA: IPTL-CTERM sorting domain-containing protein, partial [Thermoanaerobaculia bacterium]|nr:IPTL-CTERM sorting domain-containing protein [Thermoanaerobaculia bacterium]